MRLKPTLLLPLTLLLFTACKTAPPVASDTSASRRLPGPKGDGSVLLPNQWSLRPAGTQIELGDFPVNVAVHPSGKFAAILHSGYGPHEIAVINVGEAKIVSRTPIHESFYGLEFSRDGKELFCSGAGDELIHRFQFRDGILTNHTEIVLRDPKLRAVPAGIALNGDAGELFVANVWGNRVTRATVGGGPPLDIFLGTNLVPLSIAPVKESQDFDNDAATKREEASLYRSGNDDAFPYACRVDEKRQRLYVSLWAQAEVAVIDLKSNKITARWATPEHPCEMLLTRSGRLLYVANSSRNLVSVLDTESGKVIETLCTSLYPKAPPGSTPNSIALSPDEKILYAANADNNNVVVFDVSKRGKSQVLGIIPVGWYPTSVRVTPDGKHLLVANGKGAASKPNPLGPQPGESTSSDLLVEFIGRLLKGTFSIIDLPAGKEAKTRLAEYTAQARLCSPLKADNAPTGEASAGNPVPRRIGGPSPIKYCIYIVKENRTYDQVFGDLSQGNGDPKLCLFPDRVTPNLHRLVKQFVLLDNFYADAEVSADGHEWSMGAYATDFVEKMWPMDYGHNRSKKFPYPAEGYFPVAAPAGGYLWDRALEAGVSYRSYGEFVDVFVSTNQPTRARTKSLVGHIDEWYRPWDMSYSDLNRADRFISEFKRLEAEGRVPRLQIVRLPNDHTHGSTRGWGTPEAFVAQNDLALGRIVEAVSHSKLWAETAIFVVEDDAQNGPDHVDAHRTTAFVFSPYTRHGAVDSTLYSTSSMLRTMELILGLKPMSQYDAAATPMFNAFQGEPDLTPYDAVGANVDLNAKNNEHAWGGKLKMNFAREDAVDDILLNEVIWRSVRGADSPMPAPTRAAWVFVRPDDKDDD